ncbi:MAG: CRISPR-associated helicase Cas3' [Pirellulaceae bacterium]
MPKTEFSDWFEQITDHPSPRNWQQQLAADNCCRDRLIRIPTGLGKTEGVLAAWSFHRVLRANDLWPRRLVWCLPMRVLVEQTAQIARQLADQMPESQRPIVDVAMGGEDDREWYLWPERPAIIIGTQDMLLSRALNRGYASSRARWPMEFGLLNQDALWVMDEAQLMDTGLATSAQLQAFREEDHGKWLKPCHTWWMSATLQADWLRSVDTAKYHESWIRDPCTVAQNERHGGLWEIEKSISTEAIGPRDARKFSRRILDEHESTSDGGFGRITLVVCNTVDRACETFNSLREAGYSGDLELVHSRFRPADRESWRERFLSRAACVSGADRIIVATQVVEAGVDISAGCLISELAPWPSLVQRFGRCVRYGGSGRVLVADRGRDDATASPYQSEELESSWETLQQFQDVGIASLETHEESLSEEARRQLYPYAPTHLLLRKEFDELFDTTPDLTGADLDISRFIRSGDERDLQVFWIKIDKDNKGEKPKMPPEGYKPHRKELCSVPFLKARQWLCEKGKSRLKSQKRAWIWDWLDGKWEPATAESLLPGRVVCVAADSGGYTIEQGFSADSTAVVPVVEPAPVSPKIQAFDEADDQQDGEQLSYFSDWKTIACHTAEVIQAANQIATQLGLPSEFQDALEIAAFWHDWGKAHPAFQGSIRDGEKHKRLTRTDLAKAPDECWPKNLRYHYLDSTDIRPAFRHELASVLGLFAILRIYAPNHTALLGPWTELLSEIGETLPTAESRTPPTPRIERLLNCTSESFDLVAYLVASHHGKVRVGLHAAPKDQEYRDWDGRGLPIRGVREGDRLPEVKLLPDESPLPEVTLTLSPAAVGLSYRTGISWRERCIGLIDRHGPATLALLEAILRSADVRASRLTTNDPKLEPEVRT